MFIFKNFFIIKYWTIFYRQSSKNYLQPEKGTSHFGSTASSL